MTTTVSFKEASPSVHFNPFASPMPSTPLQTNRFSTIFSGAFYTAEAPMVDDEILAQATSLTGLILTLCPETGEHEADGALNAVARVLSLVLSIYHETLSAEARL